jgi:hypothetical protein
MALEQILIVAKTYPTPSTKYDETVCTAGLRKDGSWIRIYPVPFRKLDYDKQYKKFQWIEADISRNQKDFRSESYKLRKHDSIRILQDIPTDKDGTWQNRREILCKNVYYNKAKLVSDAYSTVKKTSLAVFKPASISDLKCVPAKEHDWNKNKIASIKARALQIDLFMGAENPFEVVQKVPYEFSYEFLDDEGVSSTLQIIDWEIGALYWNCIKSSGGDEKSACEKVRLKYWDDFVLKKDIYLILGTTLAFHSKKAPNPFLIIGVFPPKHKLQMSFL